MCQQRFNVLSVTGIGDRMFFGVCSLDREARRIGKSWGNRPSKLNLRKEIKEGYRGHICEF